jgi:hypothetical protein
MRRVRALARASALPLILLAGCSVITKFDRGQAIEATAELCADGIDNDEDGLKDCQDWKCLSQPSCCDLPTVVLDDSFQAPAACACPSAGAPSCAALADDACAPSADKWTSWGSPSPRVCAGGLVSCKEQDCYDVGLISRESVALEPGVKLRVTFSGPPEVRGRFTAALTFQDTAPALSDEACLPITPIAAVAAIEMVASAGTAPDTAAGAATAGAAPASDFLLQFGASVVQRVPGTTGATHDVTIGVDDTRHVEFEIDGTLFKTGAAQVIPSAGQPVHVALYGRGMTSHVSRVRLSHGAKCEDQAAWSVPAGDAVPPPSSLAAPTTQWENLAVFRPSIAATPPDGNRLFLAYSGCANAGSPTCVSNEGGAAIADDVNDTFVANTCSFVSTSGGACPTGAFDFNSPLFPGASSMVNHYDVGMGFTADPAAPADPAAAATPMVLLALVSQPAVVNGVEGREIRPIMTRSWSDMTPDAWRWQHYPSTDASASVLTAGGPGRWDEREVCCASFVLHDGKQMVWYSGRGADDVWRIGEATLMPDGSFTESAANPVLGAGPTGAIDQDGVSDPAVVWDDRRGLFRMWYVAHDSLQVTSISLAVSTDGVTWHRYPGNPVIRAGAVGLRTIANPTVLLGDDGLRMWVDGESVAHPGLGIFELRNSGAAP